MSGSLLCAERNKGWIFQSSSQPTKQIIKKSWLQTSFLVWKLGRTRERRELAVLISQRWSSELFFLIPGAKNQIKHCRRRIFPFAGMAEESAVARTSGQKFQLPQQRRLQHEMAYLQEMNRPSFNWASGTRKTNNNFASPPPAPHSLCVFISQTWAHFLSGPKCIQKVLLSCAAGSRDAARYIKWERGD